MIKNRIIFFLALLLATGTQAQVSEIPKHMVLIEVATGTWCGYCPGAAMAVDQMVEEDLSVAIIEHHGGDSYEYSGSESRIDFYGIGAFPTAKFNGTEEHIGGGTQSIYPTYKAIYDKSVNEYTEYSLSTELQNLGNNQFSVSVLSNQLSSKVEDSIRLFVVLTESHIQENWMGMSELNFVNRKMVTGDNGFYICYSCSGTFYETFEFEIEDSWNTDHMEVVTFIQEVNSKEVLQTTKDVLPEQVIQNDVGITEIIAVNDSLCNKSVAPTIRVNNNGTNNITNITFEYRVNSGSTHSYNWSGEMATSESKIIELPEVYFEPRNGNNNLFVEAILPNEQADEVNTNNVKNKSFTQVWQKNRFLHIKVATDTQGEETSWKLVDSNNEVVLADTNYESGMEYDYYFKCQNNECYTFKAFDAAGNGIDPIGFIRLTNYETQHVLATMNSFGDSTDLHFGTSFTVEPSLRIYNMYDKPMSESDTLKVTAYAQDSLIVEPLTIKNIAPIDQWAKIEVEKITGSNDISHTFLWKDNEHQFTGDSLELPGLGDYNGLKLLFRPHKNTGQVLYKYKLWVHNDTIDCFNWYVLFNAQETPPVHLQLMNIAQNRLFDNDTITIRSEAGLMQDTSTYVWIKNNSQIAADVKIMQQIVEQGPEHEVWFLWNGEEYSGDQLPEEAVLMAPNDTLKNFMNGFRSNNTPGKTVVKYTLYNEKNENEKVRFYIAYLVDPNPVFDMVVLNNTDTLHHGDTIDYELFETNTDRIVTPFTILNTSNYSIDLKLKREIIKGMGQLFDTTYWANSYYVGASKLFPDVVSVEEEESYRGCRLTFDPPYKVGEYFVNMTFFEAQNDVNKVEIRVKYQVLPKDDTQLGEEKADYRIYPNPAYNELYVLNTQVNQEHKMSYEIYNSLGVKKAQGKIAMQGEKAGIDVGHLSPGVYLLIIDVGGERHINRFVKRQ